MRLFDAAILDSLKPVLVGQHIDSILLSTYGMVIAVADVSIHCSETVLAQIAGISYRWGEAPNDGPWGVFVRQTVVDIELPSLKRLRLMMNSGDYLDLCTVEGQIESVVINYASQTDSLVMDIY